mmetsp:Transcript_19420/g.33400  ORF Transcript_19420/g.33400 Transcript_19420/m.33400 type:complete len:105 (+) Transcript_19420:1455-1769(+)
MYIQACDLTGVFSCLTLSIIEISRNCNNSIFAISSQMRISSFFHFCQHNGANLTWREFCWFSIGSHFQPSISIWCFDNFIRNVFHIFFCCWIIEFTTDQTFCCV